MRDPAPPYANEGPHALWHVSEDDAIRRFEPHVAATSARSEPLVWAVDTRHLPLYWFPRDCPRACFWAGEETTAEDAALLRGSSQVHAVETLWLERIRSTRVVAYRLPEPAFEHAGDGFWVSAEPIELRLVSSIWPLWNRVAASTLEFSGIRLRNAQPAK